MWDAIFDWSELVSRGVDVTVYLIMAGVGTLLFVIRLAMALIGGDGGDGFDMDEGGHSDASFSFFSLLSILAFFMGAGWMGLACRIDWSLGRLTSSFAAAGFGFAMMGVASGLTYATRRLNQENKVDLGTAVGVTGRVYLTVPARGKGHGQVEVTVAGRRKVMRAASDGPEMEAFSEVIVQEVQDDGCLIVTPKYPPDASNPSPDATSSSGV